MHFFVYYFPFKHCLENFQKKKGGGGGGAGGGGGGGGGAKLSQGNHVLLQTCHFCGNIVINYSYHHAYSNIFDIAESLIQNDDGPI